MSGLAMDFSLFQIPKDIESSDDEDCDPAAAVEKTLLKLEGKYVSKKRQKTRSSENNSGDEKLYEIALSAGELCGSSILGSSFRSGSPPESIMIEKDEETRWEKRHKHVLDGHECDTPTRHGPFTSSSLLEFLDSAYDGDEISEYRDELDQTHELAIPPLTVESALAELERDQFEAAGLRILQTPLPKPPENHHRSLSSHLPFILQYQSATLARQFTLIEKDICAEFDWTELLESSWMERSAELVDVRDWKGFVMRDGGDRGLDTLMARFNLVSLVGKCTNYRWRDGLLLK